MGEIVCRSKLRGSLGSELARTSFLNFKASARVNFPRVQMECVIIGPCMGNFRP